MKMFAILMSALIAQSTMAAPVASNPSLTREYHTGTVAPINTHSTACTITGTTVQSETFGPLIDFPHAILKQTKFTRSIPNEAVLNNLIEQAANEIRPVVEPCFGPNCRLPIGGATLSYSLTSSNGAAVILKATRFPTPVSDIDQKLIKFLDSNCGVAN
jgi:hypothetical protein